MLTEQRFDEILKLLDEKGTITVAELKDRLDASESTIRRDLTTLQKQGKLEKVFGGAVSLDSRVRTKDIEVTDRANVSKEEKLLIAKYAAEMISAEDFVYLDAGTTTGYMIDFIRERQATFVTNGVTHARRLAAAGFKVILLGGELKSSTEAVVGAEAFFQLKKYHFTMGFFGTNGVALESGFSTPDSSEAMVKHIAMEQTRKAYVVCDYEKFGKVSPVSFGELEDAVIITDKQPVQEYLEACEVLVAGLE